jgi:hypothetical protein
MYASSDPQVKSLGAAILTVANDSVNDAPYVDYLVSRCEMIAEMSAPAVVDEDGDISEDFLDWAATEEVDPGAAMDDVLSGHSGALLYLAWTGDSRAQPCFEDLLDSPDYGTVVTAIEGLGQIGATDVITEMEAAILALEDEALMDGAVDGLVALNDPLADQKVSDILSDSSQLEFIELNVERFRSSLEQMTAYYDP